MSCRGMTDFEREHGYSPCKLWLGEPACGVDVAALRLAGKMTVCAGTIEECRGFGNEGRFQGQPVPGHPIAVQLVSEIPTIQITNDE